MQFRLLTRYVIVLAGMLKQNLAEEKEYHASRLVYHSSEFLLI